MLRLMIVDDEETIRNALSHMIDYESIGYKVIAAAKNGMEAFDIICDEYPDVVITDIKMPILNGLELIQRANTLNAGMDYIILSGYGEFEYAKQAMQYGVKHFLLKPTDNEELVEALIEIAKEREVKAQKLFMQRTHILKEIRFPLEMCFLIEALEQPLSFGECFNKYEPLLSFPKNCLHSCICLFVESQHLKSFVYDANNIFEKYNITLQFPIMYVKNSVIMIFDTESLTIQNELKNLFDSIKYQNQSVDFEAVFQHYDSVYELFNTIIRKISRFNQILLIDQNEEQHEIKNNLIAHWKIQEIGEQLLNSKSNVEISETLSSTFADSVSLDNSKNLALAIFLWLDSSNDDESTEIACDFFRKLYSCNTVEEICELLKIIIIQLNSQKEAIDTKSKSYITLLKTYVENHLNAENLSLKWIAENYLFISVGYLSKQFIKEEGVRFSDYLNTVRMEEAKRLLLLYNNDNIKDIAKQVGFGNNPHYFSQVFKRYTTMTPSEYLEKHS